MTKYFKDPDIIKALSAEEFYITQQSGNRSVLVQENYLITKSQEFMLILFQASHFLFLPINMKVDVVGLLLPNLLKVKI